jgi:hypothetical protein
MNKQARRGNGSTLSPETVKDSLIRKNQAWQKWPIQLRFSLMMPFIHLYRKALSACFASLVLKSVALAGGWDTVPQPLILGPSGYDRRVATADAGSSLVMDSGWRCLYSVSWNQLQLNYWTGKYFEQISLASKFFDKKGTLTDQASLDRCAVKKGSALVVDQAWHMLFYISEKHGLVSAFRTGTQWKVLTLSPNATHLLGVDQAWHIVYAYDGVQRCILALHWDKTLKQWISEPIVKDIGQPGAEGVVDSGWHVLYSSHEDAPALESRGIADQATTYGIFKQWPLVATYWDGAQWRSQLIDKTALPQRPAVRNSDHRVFYARRDEVNQSRWFQPNTRPFTTTKNTQGKAITLLTNLLPQDASKGLGFKDLTQEQDTYVDNENYEINWNPNYARGWLKTYDWISAGMIDTLIFGGGMNLLLTTYDNTNLTAVDCFVPEWTTEAIPPRIQSYHSAMDQRRGDLVHQAAKAASGLVYRASAWVQVPNVYQRADGKYVKLAAPLSQSSAEVWSLTGGVWSSETRLGSVNIIDYEFKSLDQAVGNRYATVDANAAAPAAFLGPTASSVKTHGHSMNPKVIKPLLGRRFQNYTNTQEEQSDTGGISTDPASTFVFYTQAPAPDPSSNSYWYGSYRQTPPWIDSAPTAATAPAPTGQVWIVVIF